MQPRMRALPRSVPRGRGAGFNPSWPDVGADYNCQVQPAWVCRYWMRRHERYGGPAWTVTVRAALNAQVQAGDVVTVVNSWLRTFVSAGLERLSSIVRRRRRKGARVGAHPGEVMHDALHLYAAPPRTPELSRCHEPPCVLH